MLWGLKDLHYRKKMDILGLYSLVQRDDIIEVYERNRWGECRVFYPEDIGLWEEQDLTVTRGATFHSEFGEYME